MIKQTMLNFKLGVTNDEITPRSGLAIFSEFLRGFGIKELIERLMEQCGRAEDLKSGSPEEQKCRLKPS